MWLKCSQWNKNWFFPYFPLFSSSSRTLFDFPWRFKLSGVDCTYILTNTSGFACLYVVYFRTIYVKENSENSLLGVNWSHKKSPLTATENVTAFIVRNCCVSTAVAYDFIHGPIYCVTAPLKRHKFCFCFITLCFSKRRVAWRPSLKPG